MLPFNSYPGAGRRMLGRTCTTSGHHGYRLMHLRLTQQARVFTFY